MKRKTLTRQAQSGQLGINLIERVAMNLGAKWTPNTSTDVGIDGYIEFFDPTNGEALGFMVGVQSKAQDQHRKLPEESSVSFTWTVSERDLDYWLSHNLPILLIISRPPNEAYWVPIRQAFAEASVRKARRVTVDKAALRFSKEALPAILGAVAPPAVRAKGPLVRTEEVWTNLLPVAFPPRLWLAEATVPGRREVIDALREASSGDRAWVMHEKRILTFHDIETSPWPSIVDAGTKEDFDSTEWATSSDPDRRRVFTWLLNRTLQQQIGREVRFNNDGRIYSFRKGPPAITGSDLLDWDIRDTSSGRTRQVFSSWRAKADGHLIAYRHLAADLSFTQIDDCWYLAINPTIAYTSDGWNTSRFESVGITKLKSLQHNDSVWREVRFWANFLARPPSLGDSNLLTFGEQPSFSVDRGVDDEAWLSRGGAASEANLGLWADEDVA